jgi:hypothetical protein
MKITIRLAHPAGSASSTSPTPSPKRRGAGWPQSPSPALGEEFRVRAPIGCFFSWNTLTVHLLYQMACRRPWNYDSEISLASVLALDPDG